jgi:hypothetical protein
MIKQLPLIEVFRTTHTVAEEWLHIKHWTNKHGSRYMHKTIVKLVQYMAQGGAHTFEMGCAQVYYQVVDQAQQGLYLLSTEKAE